MTTAKAAVLSHREREDLKALYNKARVTLQSIGYPYVHSSNTVLKIVQREVGDDQTASSDLLRKFIEANSIKIASPTRLTNSREYKLDNRMKLAAARAAEHPVQMGIN